FDSSGRRHTTLSRDWSSDVCSSDLDRFAGADGFMIASPEYNGSVTPSLKNMLDWLSVQRTFCAANDLFKDKIVAVMACSPGGSRSEERRVGREWLARGAAPQPVRAV